DREIGERRGAHCRRRARGGRGRSAREGRVLLAPSGERREDARRPKEDRGAARIVLSARGGREDDARAAPGAGGGEEREGDRRRQGREAAEERRPAFALTSRPRLRGRCAAGGCPP